MAETSDSFLKMVFKNQEGNKVLLSLEDPKSDLTTDQIQTVMNSIINKNVFSSTGGDLVSIYDIKIVNRTTNDLYPVV